MPTLTDWFVGYHSDSQGLKQPLAFVNERDLVPRVDSDYVRSLLELYRISKGYSPSQKGGPIKQGEHSHAPKRRLGEDTPELQTLSGADSVGGATREWLLPKPNFYNFGKIIVSRNATPDDDFTLRPVSVHPDEFSKLLFCDVRVHSRRTYVENAEALLDKALVPGEAVGDSSGLAKSKDRI